MARIRPFAGWRYARGTHDLSAVCAPPYDVISDEMRAKLIARDPYNVVALELPEGPLDVTAPGNRYANGELAWNTWRRDGVLAREEQPVVYVLRQEFELAGRTVRRRAFIVEVGLEPFEAGVVIPHERTLPKALGDRFELIKATGANLSQVFGLFDDPARETDALFDTVMSEEPVAVATDDDGVVSTVWACPDAAVSAHLGSFMRDRRVFIADGHHRYTTALAYRDLMRESTGIVTGEEPFDFVMMALVNLDDPDLVVLPYHRMASSDGPFDANAFYEALAQRFDVSDLDSGHPAEVLSEQERVAFLVKTAVDARPRLAVLKSDTDLDTVIAADRSSAWKSLDVSVLQELVLWPLLGIHPDHAETLDRISFTKSAHDAFASVGSHDVAFVLRPTGLDQLKDVSLGGETMPQKSTYFYPKLLSGLVMRSASGA